MTHANPRHLESALRKTRDWFAQIPDFSCVQYAKKKSTPCLNSRVRGLSGMTTVTFCKFGPTVIHLGWFSCKHFMLSQWSLAISHHGALLLRHLETNSQHQGLTRLRPAHTQGAHLSMDKCTIRSRDFPHRFCLSSSTSNLSTVLFLAQGCLKRESIRDP